MLTPPKEGFVTKSVGEKLRHHITELDGYLLNGNEEVDKWGDSQLVVKLGSVVSVWLWIRKINEKFGDTEMHGWNELTDVVDNKWFLDNVSHVTG